MLGSRGMTPHFTSGKPILGVGSKLSVCGHPLSMESAGSDPETQASDIARDTAPSSASHHAQQDLDCNPALNHSQVHLHAHLEACEAASSDFALPARAPPVHMQVHLHTHTHTHTHTPRSSIPPSRTSSLPPSLLPQSSFSHALTRSML